MSNSNLINHLLNRNSGLLKRDFRSKLFKDRLSIVKNLYKKDLMCHYGCVNAIEFSHDGNWLISGGDDRRVLLWNVEKSLNDQQEPRSMSKQHSSNIFCLCFNSHQSRIFSGSNDDMVYVHDVNSGDPIDIFYHSKPVYGISVDPSNESIFSTAGEDGRVLLFDMRVSNTEMKCLVRYRSAFHSVMFHPIDDNFMITANAKEGASLWDNRSHKVPYLRYGGDDAAQSCMSVRFNTLGTQVVALRRRLPPILYSTIHEDPICQFYHSDYYNSCTMKSCTFAGESDEFVMSGSDDFNLYVWRVADVDLELRHQWVDENQMVLYGHRSIVNQVRYNPQRCLIASSGVEKVVKLWSPFEMDKWSGGLAEGLTQGETPREVYTHEEYISLNMTHDYSTQNTNEDPRMMAFFDYLVQQEIEGWNESSNQSESDHSDNTSRPDSPTSDTEPTTNVNTVNKPSRVHRDRTVRRAGEAGQRHKYRNRIAYLIATKRKSLKRLALKRVSRPPSRRMKNKFVPRQTKRNFMRASGRKPYDKKIRRLSASKYKKPVSHEQTSDSEVPQKLKKRRILQHLNTNSYRSFRRKAKTPLSSTSNTSTRAADKSDSSSDDDHDDNDLYDRHMPSTSTAPLDINMPSTSTGITANGKGYSFRIATNNNDSDDDQSIPDQLNPSSDNMLRVIRSPPIQSNNSAHYQNISDDEDDDDDENTTERPRNIFNMPSRHQPPKEPHHNGRKKLRANEVNEESSSTNHGEEDYASTNSNSLQSSTSDDGGSNDSFIEFNSRKRKLSAVAEEDHTNGNARNFHLTYSNINNISNSTSGNSFNGQFETPSTKIRNSRGSSTVTTTTPDSGFRSLISPSSSTSQAPANGNRMNGSKQEMMKKIDNIKRNYRKNLQEDDDDSD